MKTDHLSAVTVAFRDLQQLGQAIPELIDSAIPRGYISFLIPQHMQKDLHQQDWFGVQAEGVPFGDFLATGQLAGWLGKVEQQSDLSQALQELGHEAEAARFYQQQLEKGSVVLVLNSDNSVQKSRAADVSRKHGGEIFHREKDPEEENLPRPSQML